MDIDFTVEFRFEYFPSLYDCSCRVYPPFTLSVIFFLSLQAPVFLLFNEVKVSVIPLQPSPGAILFLDLNETANTVYLHVLCACDKI